jgi:hypothetical protein
MKTNKQNNEIDNMRTFETMYPEVNVNDHKKQAEIVERHRKELLNRIRKMILIDISNELESDPTYIELWNLIMNENTLFSSLILIEDRLNEVEDMYKTEREREAENMYNESGEEKIEMWVRNDTKDD